MSGIDYEALLPRKEQGAQISRKIFQVFVRPNDDEHVFDFLPVEIKKNMEHIQTINAGWEYTLFDNEAVKSFILEHYGAEIWSYYERISPVYGAARADFFRYLLIYQEGGMYIDIKTSLEKPLDEVLRPEDKFILTHWDNLPGGQYEGVGIFGEVSFLPRGEYIQWCVASTSGHPLLRAVILEMLRRIDEYNPFRHGAGLWGVLRTTGPVMYTQTIEALRPTLTEGKDYRLLSKPQDIGLRYSIYDSEGIYGHKKALKANYNKATTPIIVRPGSPIYTGLAQAYLFARLAVGVLRDKIVQRLS
ncbi:MAG: glycosyltransferase [Porphyromonadaceae bacterium]|nr:glycosyltransferase [Porphyromonadaceae bacterium]